MDFKHLLLPILGEDCGDKNVVDYPARRAEYNTDSTVVSMPRTSVPVLTALDLLRPLHS